MMKKEGLIILFVLFMISSVIAVEVVQVQNTTPTPEKTSWFGFIKNPIFWYVIIGLLLFMIFLICLFFLVRWIIKFIKKRNDVFYRMRSERISLAKTQRSYPSKHWWKIQKNTPIRIVKKIDGQIKIGNIIGYHRGDYTTSEGNLVIALNVIGDKHWFIYPRTSLLVIPDREEVNFYSKDSKGEQSSHTIKGIPRAKDIIQFNEGEILIHAESISQVGYFLIPVLKSQNGKVIDLSLPIYQTFKEVLLNEYLYEQSTEFVSLSKKAMDINPHIRAETKVRDPNSSVDIPHNQ